MEASLRGPVPLGLFPFRALGEYHAEIRVRMSLSGEDGWDMVQVTVLYLDTIAFPRRLPDRDSPVRFRVLSTVLMV